MRRARRLLPLAIVLLASGCEIESAICSTAPGLAIRLRAKDAQSGTFLGNPTVTATMVDRPDYVVEISRLPGDSTVTDLRGDAGTYDVTVAKAGYESSTLRTSVVGGGSCVPTNTVELVAPLTRLP